MLRGLASLETLDLSNNNLDRGFYFRASFFARVPKLKFLYLKSIAIDMITGNMFDGVVTRQTTEIGHQCQWSH